MAMQHSATMPFQGDVEKAFGLAEPALTALGFRVDHRTATELVMTGPGMNNSNQSPLVGASRIQVTKGNRELSLDADLGGVQTMSRFVMLFPPALTLVIAFVLIVVFLLVKGPGRWLYTILLAAIPIELVWLIIGSYMARRFRRQTCAAMDTLLANMVAVGEAR